MKDITTRVVTEREIPPRIVGVKGRLLSSENQRPVPFLRKILVVCVYVWIGNAALPFKVLFLVT